MHDYLKELLLAVTVVPSLIMLIAICLAVMFAPHEEGDA